MKKVIINQPIGLGDILFCMPIAKKYADLGHKVYWPTNTYSSIQKYFDYVHFIGLHDINFDHNKMTIHEDDEKIVIPLRWCANLMSAGNSLTTMSDKYKFMGLPLETWKTIEWKRDVSSENKLFYEVLQLKDGEKYNLLSENFTPTFSHKFNIKINNNLKNIRVEKINDFTLLDWAKVIENATNLHTVGSSINILIEVLNTCHEEYILYPRVPHEYDCNNYNYLYSKPTGEYKIK